MRFRMCLWSTILCAIFGGIASPLSAQECDPAQDLVCITQINVTLDEDCQFELTPAILLSGDAACISATNFEIEVDDNAPANGPVVDGCGAYTYNIREVLAPGDDGPALQCWGNLTAYDASSPVLFGLPQVDGTLLCNEVSSVDINELPANVSRCWIADGGTGLPILGTLDPALRLRLEAAGGLPDFRDACGRVEICVSDQVSASNGCNDQTILRRFVANDGIDCEAPPGQPNESTIGFQPITFLRPDISDVEGVEASVLFECDEDFPLLPPNQFGVRNPAPRQSDYPFFLIDDERVSLDAPFCNIGTNFEDGPRQETCPETYRFVRTYTVIDWCQPAIVETFTQLVKVGDFEAPDITPPTQDLNFDGQPDDGPIFFSTSQNDCTAAFLLPAATLTDNCSESSSYIAFILPFGSSSEVPFGPFVENEAVINIPFGEHIIRYIAVDGCDNADTLDVPLSIGDLNPPFALCEDGLDISLNGFGQAGLFPSAIDANSRDDCSDELLLEIARVEEGEQPVNGWLDQVTFTCEDLGNQSVALRVTDESGNQNTCWLTVLIEDKLVPICQPPPAQIISCVDPMLSDLPADLALAFDEDPSTTAALLNAAFGAGSGIDNCSLDTVTQTVIDTRDACGVGIVVRNFVAIDGEGLSSGNIVCQQVVTITAQHDYTLRFPADASSEECIEPDFSELEFEVNACDLITTTTSLDTFVATADECYKLRVTYEVINWCEYSTEADPYVVPRDANNNDILEEPTWLHILPLSTETLADDIAYLDQDANRFNGFIAPLDEDDPNGVVPGDGPQGYGNDESRGGFLYRQFIKVYDDTAPVLGLGDEQTFVDLDGDCSESPVLSILLSDACTAVEAYQLDVELDLFFNDIDGDDTLTLADFIAVGPGGAQPIASNLGNDSFDISFSEGLPLGLHALRLRGTDGCGNTTIGLLTFVIVDGKAPAPVCINGLTATLMPNGETGPMAEIWASEFVASLGTDCTNPIELAIYRSSEADSSAFTGPQPGDSVLTVDCEDRGNVLVRVYAIDGAGNADYCETVLNVQAFQDNICPEEGGGNILGRIAVESDLPMPNVEVTVSNSEMNEIEFTDQQGRYLHDGLTEGEDYTIQPRHDEYPLNGVTTIDILTITYHLTGQFLMTSPYQLIAADADDSGNLTVGDLVSIRMLILGLSNNFEGNTSWRFVDADYEFPDPTDPWAENFPEVVNFNDLEGAAEADFVAIKTGDVNNSAVPGMLLPPDDELASQSEGRSGHSFVLTQVETILANEITEVPIYVNESIDIAAIQGTFELADGVELVEIIPGLAGHEHFGTAFLERGWLTMAYTHPEGIVTDLPLATLRIQSSRNIPTADALQLSSAFTPAVAYTKEGEALEIEFAHSAEDEMERPARIRLHPLVPNPVRDEVFVSFDLDKDRRVQLEFVDVQGRVLHQIPMDAAVGYNRVPFDRYELGLSAGMYYLRLSGEGFSSVQPLAVE
ncbi:MAG: hypothetical protein AAFY36_02895 [Bacteroidota bacterium]